MSVAKKLAKKAQPDISSSAAALDEELATFKDDYRPPARLETGERQNRGGQDGPRSSEFPVKISEPDPRDTYIDIKTELLKQKDGAGHTPFGVAQLSDKDIQWLERKKQQIQRVGFQQFLADYFDLTNPAEANFVFGIMPEYLQEREQQIDQISELQNKIAKIRLRGPQSKEDLLLVYGLKTGALNPPKGAIYSPKDWYPDQGSTEASFKRGIFSPRRLIQGGIGQKKDRYDILNKANPYALVMGKAGISTGAKDNIYENLVSSFANLRMNE